MLNLIYMSDSYIPENGSSLIAILPDQYTEIDLEMIKNQAIERFSWISEPSFTIKSVKAGEVF